MDSLIDGGTTTLVSYSYLGLNSAVQVTYPQPSTQYTLLGSSTGNNPTTGDIYWGLDLFGRIVDSRWYNTGTSADVDRIKYGYDQNSNRIWRQNPVATAAGAAFDELYHYDGLQRLKDMQRGTLNGTQTSITSPTFGQCWTLDSTGNWAGFNEAATGSTWTTVQTRSANTVNEITGITTTTGTAWANPAYDAAGNMTSVPQPLNLGSNYTATYDAWNRLVKLVDAPTGNTVQQNQYDARNFRTQRLTYTSGTLSETRQLYYTSNWREIEDRLGSATTAERQYVWGVRYIDDLVVYDRSSVRLYSMQDANWNVTGIVDATGTVQERFAYSAYGQPLFLNASFVPHSTQASSYLFDNFYCGYRYDAATGLYSVRFRLFHPVLAGWLTRDPLRPSSGLHFYLYAFPLISLDPLGLFFLPTIFYGTNADRFWNQSNKDRALWFNNFWRQYGQMISQSARKHCVPQELLAAIIANEMIDYSGLESVLERYAGLGSSLGPAQLTVRIALKYDLFPEYALSNFPKSSGFAYSRDMPGFRGDFAASRARRQAAVVRAALNNTGRNIDAAGKLLGIYLDKLCQQSQQCSGKEGTIAGLPSDFMDSVVGIKQTFDAQQEEFIRDICARKNLPCDQVAALNVSVFSIKAGSAIFNDDLDVLTNPNENVRLHALNAGGLDGYFGPNDIYHE